jgi:methylenetetrahydrofolate dehydrogenase (NADP+)/methenyltetrahydrofolate cyclohydrolase
MTATIIDGTAVASSIRTRLSKEVEKLSGKNVYPGLAAVIVGNDPASISYVTAKAKACAEVGIMSETFALPSESTEADLDSLITKLNLDDRFQAILPQLPLPSHFDAHKVIDAISPEKDADGLHPVNLGRLLRGEIDGPLPCTPHGVLQLLQYAGVDPVGKHVVIVGRSTLVGRPLSVLLSNKTRGANGTVTICHSATENLQEYTYSADILIVAVGQPLSVTAEMVQEGAVVIDVGVNRIEDSTRKRGWRLVGDVDFSGVSEVASYITKVPGGVGPMTIAMLLANTVDAAARKAGLDAIFLG